MAKVPFGSLTAADARASLLALVETHGSQAAVAQRLGVSDAYVSDLLNNRRSFSDTMLEKLGLRRIVVKR